MEKVDIHNYASPITINGTKHLFINKTIPENVILIGRSTNEIVLSFAQPRLDLSNVICDSISLPDQTDDSISNYKLPDSLKKLDLSYNDITKLPKLPSCLEKLLCHHNKLSYIPKLPDDLNLIF